MEVKELMVGVDSYAIRGLPSGSVIHDLGLTPHYLASLARHDCVILIHMESYGCDSACVASPRSVAVANRLSISGGDSKNAFRKFDSLPSRRLDDLPVACRLAEFAAACRSAAVPPRLRNPSVPAPVPAVPPSSGRGRRPLYPVSVRLPAIVLPYGCPDHLARRDAPLGVPSWPRWRRSADEADELGRRRGESRTSAFRGCPSPATSACPPSALVGGIISPRHLRASGVGDGMSSRCDVSAFSSPAAKSAKVPPCVSVIDRRPLRRARGQRVACCDGVSTKSAQSLHDISTRPTWHTPTRHLHKTNTTSPRDAHREGAERRFLVLCPNEDDPPEAALCGARRPRCGLMQGRAAPCFLGDGLS